MSETPPPPPSMGQQQQQQQQQQQEDQEPSPPSPWQQPPSTHPRSTLQVTTLQPILETSALVAPVFTDIHALEEESMNHSNSIDAPSSLFRETDNRTANATAHLPPPVLPVNPSWQHMQSAATLAQHQQQQQAPPVRPTSKSFASMNSTTIERELSGMPSSFYASDIAAAPFSSNTINYASSNSRIRRNSNSSSNAPPLSTTMSSSDREKSVNFLSSSNGLHTGPLAPAAAGGEGDSFASITVSNNNGGGVGEGGGEGQGEGGTGKRASLRHMVHQGLRRGTEDGDMSDWSRCMSTCQRVGKKLCRGVGSFSRKMYHDAARPWTKKFSDVDCRRGCGGDEGRMDGGREGRRGLPRTISVEDVRRQYVFGTLSSFALENPGVKPGEGGREVVKEVEVIRKEDFLMKLAVALLSYGCPIPRIEHSMQVLLKTLGVEGSVSVLPSMMFVSFGIAISSESETHILRVGGGLDVYKLRRVNHLVNQILEHRILDLHHAISKLDSLIAEPPLYNWQTKVACYTIASACVAPLYFHGSLTDGLLTGLVGFVAGCLWVLSDQSYILGKVGLIFSAILSSFLGTVLSAHIPGRCALAIHFGPITYLLPGWSITSAVIELATQNVLSGTTRMVTALMNALLLGFGLDLGHRMAFWEGEDSWTSTEHCTGVSNGVKVPLFLTTVTCFTILMKAAPAQWLGMMSVATISYVTINLASTAGGMSPSSATVVTAFLVGIAGNLYAYATNSPALIPILSGVFLIVPGGMSVKGVHALINNDMSGGLAFGSGMMVVAICISIGLFAASILMYKPKVRLSNTVFF